MKVDQRDTITELTSIYNDYGAIPRDNRVPELDFDNEDFHAVIEDWDSPDFYKQVLSSV